MTIQNYGELKTAVANWLHKSNAAADIVSRIPEFIELAEDRLADDLDSWEIETEADITIDSRTAALPSDFIEQRRHYIDVAEPVQRVTYAPPEFLWSYDQSKAADFPRYYTIEGSNLVFSPTPDSTYTGKWLYLARPATLASDTDTNTILTKHRGLYLYASLLEARAYLKQSPDTLVWATMYDEAKERFNLAARRGRFPKGQKVSRSNVIPSSGGRTKQ